MTNKQIKKEATPRAIDLRDRLKAIVEEELDGLPATLDGLTGKERLDVILKLMPLIVPKSKPVHHGKANRGASKYGSGVSLICRTFPTYLGFDFESRCLEISLPFTSEATEKIRELAGI